MLFHSTHGTNIIIEEEETRATRLDSFCHGITFSKMPLEINVHVTILVTQIHEWSGALRIGVTAQNPESLEHLPRYACPDLVDTEGFWADAIPEKLVTNGTRITFYLTEDNSLQLFINNEHRGAHLSDLPVHKSLWLLLDIYGNTESVQFTSNDSLPVEIVARGPQAMYAFRLAKNSGTLPVFRTRLVLLGQDGAGKTSLKNLLTGKSYHEREHHKSEAVVTTGWCEINQHDNGSWLMAEETNTENEGATSLSEGYFEALAANIAKELLLAEKHHQKSEELDTSSATKWMQRSDRKHVCTAHYRRRHARNSSDQDKQEEMTVEQLRNDFLNELPDRVVQMVDKFLLSKENWQNESFDNQFLGSNILLNIWDLSGKSIYQSIHQLFLSRRAVYVLVFNLCQDLDAPSLIPVITNKGTMVEIEESEMTNLDELCFWLNCIYAHTSSTIVTKNQSEEFCSPAVIIVGTHKKSLHPDPEIRGRMIEEKFQKIEEVIRNKVFYKNVAKRYFAVDSSSEEDQEVCRLRECIEETVSQEPYIGEEIPLKWLKFEEAMSRLVEKGITHISRQQLQEVARNEGIDEGDNFSSVLEFYHDLGLLIHYESSLEENLFHTVIIDPEWLIEAFGKVFAASSNEDKWPDSWNWISRLKKDGILEDGLINQIWADCKDQKPNLLALMDKYDLLCERKTLNTPDIIILQAQETKSWYIPSQLKKHQDVETWIPPENKSIQFYINFNGFLPVSLYHKLVTKVLRWTQEISSYQQPKLSSRVAWFHLDADHDFLLQMSSIKLSRIKVIITKKTVMEGATEETLQGFPHPSASAQVRHFLEGALADIRSAWIQRLQYQTYVVCPCGCQCSLHSVNSCKEETCLHFLLLDECLANRVVSCGHRRIKTHFIRQHFPFVIKQIRPGAVLPENAVTKTLYNETVLMENVVPNVPRWLKGAAKLLNAGSEGNDWTALANKLGYKPRLIEEFGEDLNPGLSLVTDWLVTSGNTRTSVDMLLACLSRIHRDDIIDVIHKSEENNEDQPPVFLSYHWDVQDEVLLLRTKLEQAGFRCWMDIGQIGGGDHLQIKLYEGISNAKIVVSCITPKYVVSNVCSQEVILADLLGKPIVPAMIQETPWPPPGAMALVLGPLLYIGFDGSGGHGGSGVHADWQSKFNELCLRVGRYVDPVPVLPVKPPDVHNPPTDTKDTHQWTSRLSLADLVSYPLVSPRQDSLPLVEESDSSPVDTPPPTPRVISRGHVQRCTICAVL
uniref:non-specific serine/threonine protein kinase n=1 Tax=Strigamia maritima TaxID=126957 RepID=T1IR33_STRMM